MDQEAKSFLLARLFGETASLIRYIEDNAEAQRKNFQNPAVIKSIYELLDAIRGANFIKKLPLPEK